MDFKAKPKAPATVSGDTADTLATKGYVDDVAGSGGGSVDIADNLTTDDATKALSAKQGRILNEKTPNKEYYVPNPSKPNDATGNAEGYRTTASGNNSHAEGVYAEASGIYSHAEGDGTTAYGYASHAEGHQTIAYGNNSHAEGYSTTASGIYSHAQNEGTIAQGMAQTAIGKYNIPDETSALILGNGLLDDERSNALTVDWSGNLDIALGAEYSIGGKSMVTGDMFDSDTTVWAKYEVETITKTKLQSQDFGSGIFINIVGSTFDWEIGDKVVGIKFNVQTGYEVVCDIQKPVIVSDFELQGISAIGVNPNLYPSPFASGVMIPAVVGNNPDIGGVFVTYGMAGQSVEVKVLKTKTYLRSENPEEYPTGIDGNFYYEKLRPFQALEYRIKLLEDSMGDISSVLDAINGEVI